MRYCAAEACRRLVPEKVASQVREHICLKVVQQLLVVGMAMDHAQQVAVVVEQSLLELVRTASLRPEEVLLVVM